MLDGKPSLAKMETGFLDADLQKCRDANVPMVCIPQSVIYELTNFTNNGYNNEQDIIHHTLSNQDRLDSLTKELENIHKYINSTKTNLDIALELAKQQYADYTSLFIHNNKINNFDFPDVSAFAAIELPKTAEEKLSSNQLTAINDLNKLFSGIRCEKKENVEEALNACKEQLVKTKKHVEELSNYLLKLENQKSAVQTELLLEQGRAIIELKNNPARVLDGDEILRNHWENALLMPEY